MPLGDCLRTDLHWWIDNIASSLNNIKIDKYDIEIFTDASLTGWGACCGTQKTHGYWSDLDKTRHINYLELLAIFYGIKCYAYDLPTGNVLIRCDNTTAISYINRMGSVRFPALCSLAKEIWQWCERNNIWLFASYISSENNSDADKESRRLCDETEWSLSQDAFDKIKFQLDSSRDRPLCD
ncbi:hypothetical protein NQ315_002059 [Exocentrus adspersus]|uniref:RNase H type-1 domain-containing protein n=1 Tax=Exocentrus adspersus TaxID=1586481 RepID=A0AAV8VFW3_9CUCU|nr:hypothetical protein NQ315_002059 [Exocentrus adspersus]